MTAPKMIPLPDRRRLSPEEMLRSAEAFLAQMLCRRSVRQFSNQPVSPRVIEACVRAAGTAPSGANQQPWHFVIVADPVMKTRIRRAAEQAERRFYEQTAPPEWLAALAPLGTSADKPFLELAPYLICLFVQPHSLQTDGRIQRHYFALESAGIAAGFLIAALHHAGLACLPYTPSERGFLNDLLGRPKHEHALFVLATGLPAPNATVPDIDRKPFEQIATFV